MNLNEIKKKLDAENVKSMEEAKKVLTMEELIFYIAKENKIQIVPESECLIADILKMLESNNYSVRHSLLVLETAKELLPYLSKLRY